MIRPLTALMMLAAAGAGLHLYSVKQGTTLLERELRDIRRQTEAARERTQVLRAEWALLNEPDRLRAVVQRHLPLDAMTPTQFVREQDLARRLPPVQAFAGAPSLFAPAPGDARREAVMVARAEPAAPQAPTAAPQPPAAAPQAPAAAAQVAAVTPAARPSPAPPAASPSPPPAVAAAPAHPPAVVAAAVPRPVAPRPQAPPPPSLPPGGLQPSATVAPGSVMPSAAQMAQFAQAPQGAAAPVSQGAAAPAIQGAAAPARPAAPAGIIATPLAPLPGTTARAAPPPPRPPAAAAPAPRPAPQFVRTPPAPEPPATPGQGIRPLLPPPVPYGAVAGGGLISTASAATLSGAAR